MVPKTTTTISIIFIPINIITHQKCRRSFKYLQDYPPRHSNLLLPLPPPLSACSRSLSLPPSSAPEQVPINSINRHNQRMIFNLTNLVCELRRLIYRSGSSEAQWDEGCEAGTSSLPWRRSRRSNEPLR